jgi:hypothetical protein
MPGSKGGEYNWNYMTPAKIYRTVSASDAVTQADVEAIAELIDRTAIKSAYDTRVAVAVTGSASAAYGIRIFVDLGITGVSDNSRWCLCASKDSLTGSTVTMFNDIPCGIIKILIVSLSNGPVKVSESHTL